MNLSPAEMQQQILQLLAWQNRTNQLIANLTANVTQREQEIASVQANSWLILTGMFVFFMKTGFAILEAGAISRNLGVPLILLKNVIDTAITAIAWYLIGYGLAYGDDFSDGGNVFIGDSYFATYQIPTSRTVSYSHWFFQYTFCAVSATIQSGSMAERTRTATYLVFIFFYSSWIYPVAVHWVWSHLGWMSVSARDPIVAVGLLDYAGSGAVHLMGGTAALAACMSVGERYKRWDETYIAKGVFNPQSHAWMALGTLMLWFSWLGFNTGATNLAKPGSDEIMYIKLLATLKGLIAVNTILSGAAGCLSCTFSSRLIMGRMDLPTVLNGILAGTVAITSGCAYVDPWAAVITGGISGLIYVGNLRLLRILKLDDPVDACSVHLANGVWGLISPGIFATKHNVMLVTGRSDHYGLFMGGGAHQFALQLIGVAVLFLWSFVWSMAYYQIANALGYLRLAPEKEKQMFQERLDELARRTITLQSTTQGFSFADADKKAPTATDRVNMSELS